MKRLSQSGSSNFCPELRKNALLISQSHFSNFALHVITKEIRRAEQEDMNILPPPPNERSSFAPECLLKLPKFVDLLKF